MTSMQVSGRLSGRAGGLPASGSAQSAGGRAPKRWRGPRARGRGSPGRAGGPERAPSQRPNAATSRGPGRSFSVARGPLGSGVEGKQGNSHSHLTFIAGRQRSQQARIRWGGSTRGHPRTGTRYSSGCPPFGRESRSHTRIRSPLPSWHHDWEFGERRRVSETSAPTPSAPLSCLGARWLLHFRIFPDLELEWGFLLTVPPLGSPPEACQAKREERPGQTGQRDARQEPSLGILA